MENKRESPYKGWTDKQWDEWNSKREDRDLDGTIAVLDKIIAEKEAQKQSQQK